MLVVAVQRLSRVSDRLLPRLSFLSICVVLVHSTVDYPLRTMGIAVSFAFFNAILFVRNRDPASDSKLSPDVWNGKTDVSGVALYRRQLPGAQTSRRSALECCSSVAMQ